MSRELVNDFLLVSRYADPPNEATVMQALSSAGLGKAAYQPADPDTQQGARTRVGTYKLTANASPTAATVRVVVAQHTKPALAGMGEGAFNQLTRRLSAEDTQTLRVGTLTCDVRLKTSEEQAPAALRWAMGIVRAFVSLTSGAVIDPAAQGSWGAARLGEMLAGPLTTQLTVHDEAWGSDRRWLHTHGLQKFGRPELDLAAIPVALRAEAEAFLLEVADNLANGQHLSAGQEIDMDDLGSVVAVTAVADAEHAAPFSRLRLADIPEPGERQGVSAARLLTRMAFVEAQRRREMGDIAGAIDTIERILSANSDDCSATFLKASILLDGRQPHEALALGELMELRSPIDYRGPLAVGLSLLAIGRSREALNALDRAIEREPEAAQAFAARAEAHRLLGDEQRASMDRARAVYLSI